MRDQRLQSALLEWYDRAARDLPWRVPPHRSRAGERADPYRVWMSEIMLQQTTVVAVAPYFEAFTTRWPTVSDLANARDGDVMEAWAGLGYYARARNLLKCARVVAELPGARFPETEEGLLALPGIGPYTAAAIAAIAFGRPAVVLDGNIERVMARFFDEETALPEAKPILKRHAAALTPEHRPGDHAQALMDLGATICTPRNPACGICPWMEDCAGRASGRAPDLPRKAAKKAKPVRRGRVYLLRREDGAILLETRPDMGLLGGMTALPTGPWDETDSPGDAPPMAADWEEAGEIRHTFTHFHLRLAVAVADVPMAAQPDRGMWRAAGDVRPEDLPTVFAKALRQGLSALDPN